MEDEITGTGSGEPQNVPSQSETIESSSVATATSGSTGPKEDHFYDPNELPEELKPHWKRMQGTFTKKMQQVKSIRDKAEMVDKFNTDSDYARQIIQQRAQALGITLTKAEAQDIADSESQDDGVSAPRDLVKNIEKSLSPELKWMAKDLANSAWKAQQAALEPFKREQERNVFEQRQREYESLSDELSAKMPGWEEHEDDMKALKSFLESPEMKHPRFGSKLEILANIITGNASAIHQATQRLNQAGRSRIVTGGTSRSAAPDITDRIMKARNRQEAWDIAKKEALEMARRQGGE